MDQYYHHHHIKYNSTATNPSFSSTLLDAIYRSIDFETQTTHHHQGEVQEHQVVVYKESMRKKQCSGNISSSMKPKKMILGDFRDEEEMANYQRACLIEKWMEKKVVVNSRNSNEVVDASASSYTSTGCTTFFNNSSSSSSDSSSGGGFSSSEAESVYGFPSSSRKSFYGMKKPKPIRTTSVSEKSQSHHNNRNYLQPKAEKHEESSGRFVKTKSRALKIYGDLKKVKQPISPGGRLASFLNSIFTAGNSKKAKYDDDEITDSERKLKSANTSTCSSASSFSRSCLSKKSGNINGSSGMKRSVRFYPVSVIVDEDSQPCGQKSLYDHDENLKTGKNNCSNIRGSLKQELQFQTLEKNRRVQESARDLLRNFQKRVDQCEFDMIRNSARISDQESTQNHNNILDDDDDDDDDEDMDDDDASYASSDLFELDNLSAIGMDHQRYLEELPVYETTHLVTNRAIANGLIL